MSAAPTPLSRSAFNDRRLQLAQLMAKQRGHSYAGLSSVERDVYLDIAGDALRALDDRLLTLWITETAREAEAG